MSGFEFAPYVSASKPCSDGATPGAKALLKYVLDEFDFAHSLGIYNCRTIRNSSKISQHAKGRALDIGVTPIGGKRDPRGDDISRLLVAHAADLGIMFLKWGAKGDYSKDGGAGQWSKNQYKGNPVGDSLHMNHVHVDLHPTAAANLNYATIEAILGRQAEPKVFDQAAVVATTVDHEAVRRFAERRNLGVLQVLEDGKLIDTASGVDAAVGSWGLVVGGLAAKRAVKSGLPAFTALVGETRVETAAMVAELGERFPADEWERRGVPVD